MFCAKMKSSPRDSTGIERAPSRCSSARPAGSVRMLIDSNSIPRTERNSLSLRQLVQPGCQNAFNGAASGIATPCVNLGPLWRPHRGASTALLIVPRATVDVDRLAGDEAAILGHQEQAGRGDLVDLALAAERDAGGVGRPVAIPFGVGACRVDASRRHNVDPDIEW